MRVLLFVSAIFCSFATQAAQYKCYSSQYPKDLEHAFQDGYVLLDIQSDVVKMDYYYVNQVAHETTIEYSVTYKVGGEKGGSGRLSQLLVGKVQTEHKVGIGDSIEPIYFEKHLIENTDLRKSGIVGKFVFNGHGYSYDWNVCYNLR